MGFLKGKSVFITGISGFVGSRLAKHLLNEGANVSGLVRRRADGSLPLNIRYLRIEREINIIEGDLCEISSIAFALDRCRPEIIYHFAAQSFIPSSFSHCLSTMDTNCMGTTNLLESVRAKGIDPVIIFSGSSEEYGLVIISNLQYDLLLQKYGAIFPPPALIPELPIAETNPLRPMSPYAVSKIYADHLMRNYHISFGLRTVVSRGFNHEGAGRGIMFVTSAITRQVMQLKRGEVEKIVIGNVNAFRDWSHVDDIIRGYCLLAEKGICGEVYNQGSQRTNSVLSYLLLSLECAGYAVEGIETINGQKEAKSPTEVDKSQIFKRVFEKTKVDRLMLEGKLEFHPSDIGIVVITDKGKIIVEFDMDKFRPADVPVLLADTGKIQNLGFETTHTLKDIIKDQLNYYLDPSH